MINKELLSAAMQEINIEKSYVEHNKLNYTDIHGNRELLDISQIIHFFIIWAEITHNWSIASYYSKIDNGWLLYEISTTPYGLELPYELDGYVYNNPFEPVLKACQWILNKDSK